MKKIKNFLIERLSYREIEFCEIMFRALKRLTILY